MLRSTPNQPPYQGPREIVYPVLSQVLRVTAQADAAGVYPALVQQSTPPLAALRGREPVYLWEANSIPLAAAYYRARLVGTYSGVRGTLPLYLTSLLCCVPRPGGGSSSSSGASRASSSRSPSLSPSSSLSSKVAGPCVNCPGPVANHFTIDFSAATDASCDCSGLRNLGMLATHTLVCTWALTGTITCSGTTNLVASGSTLVVFADGSVQVQFTFNLFANQVFYKTAAGIGWDCQSALTVPFLSQTGTHACNWPATITLTPV